MDVTTSRLSIDVVTFTGDSGLTDYAVSLCRALSSLVDVRLVTSGAVNPSFLDMGFAVAQVFRRSRHYPIDVLRFVAGTLRRRPDWLLFQGPLKFAWVDALVIRFLRLFSVRAAIFVHDVLPHYPKPWSRWTHRFYYRSFERVIAHSRDAEQGLKGLGIRQDIQVVPHGIYDIFDLSSPSKAQARQAVGQLADDDFVVLFFGHIEPRKGLMPLLDLARSMERSGEPVKFLLAGKGDVQRHGEALRGAFEAARLAPNVIIHDRRIPFEAVENYFAASDVIILPYLEGTTSGVLKIALAFGKPVLGTRVGDFVEELPPGGGVLIETGERLPERLRDALAEMRAVIGSHTGAMAAARSRAPWSGIARAVLEFLETGHAKPFEH